VIAFDSFITEKTIEEVKKLLNDEKRLTEMAENNYMLGWK